MDPIQTGEPQLSSLGGHVAGRLPLPDQRQLELKVADEVIEKRLAAWQRPEPKFKRGYLALYSRLAESADKGAVIRNR